MYLLFDLPKQLIQLNVPITGASTMTRALIEAIITRLSATKVVMITTADTDTFEAYQQTLAGADIPIYQTAYTDLEAFISKEGCPDLAVVPDFQLDFLLHFRNRHRLHLPIIHFTHSIQEPNQIAAIGTLLNYGSILDSIIFPSESCRTSFNQFVATQYPGQSCPLDQRVIPFGIDLEKFPTKSDKKTLRKAYNLPEEKVIFLHFSRLNPFTKMDVFPLIRDFEQSLGNEPDALLLIAGEVHSKSYADELHKYVKEAHLETHIQFIHDLDQSRVHELFLLADVFTSMSDNSGETFGLTVVEAMAAELPVVITDWNGYKELIDDAKDGYKIPTYWMEETAEFNYWFNALSIINFGDRFIQSVAYDHPYCQRVLRDLYHDQNLRRTLGRHARLSAEKKFSTEVMMTRCETYFRNRIQAAKAAAPQTFKGSLTNDFGAGYRHFPTRLLSLKDTYRLSPEGHHIVDGEKNITIMEKHIRVYKEMVPVLTSLRAGAKTGEEIMTEINAEKPSLSFTLMYLLKHTIIEVTKPN